MNVRVLLKKRDSLGQNSCRISQRSFIEKIDKLLERVSYIGIMISD